MSILKHSGLRALGTASVAACVLVACGGSGSANGDLPLIRGNLAIKAVSQGGVCEVIPVRVTPKQLKGQANKYANNKMMVTDVTMTGPTDENGAPIATARTRRCRSRRATGNSAHRWPPARRPACATSRRAATSRSSSSTAPWAAAALNRRLARRWSRSRRRSRAKCRPTARRRLLRQAETRRRSDRGRHGQPCRPFYPCETRSRTTRR